MHHSSSMPKRPWHIRRHGICMVLTCLVSLVLILAVHSLIGFLPHTGTHFNISQPQLSVITGKTADLLDRTDTDVEFLWVCYNGDTDPAMELFLSRYVEANDRMSLRIVDPEKDADLLLTYSNVPLQNFSLIVRSDKRFQIVHSEALYYYTNDFIDQYLNQGKPFPLSEQDLYALSSDKQYGAYVTQTPTHTYFRGESLLSSAVDYVTVTTVPQAYTLTGHGEKPFPDTLSQLLRSMAANPKPLDLSALDAVPADAGCLVMFAPTVDLSETEGAMIRAYLRKGGSLLLITSPETVEACPRIMEIGKLFGLSAEAGVVVDPDPKHHVGETAHVLIPDINKQHGATYFAAQNGFSAQMPHAHALAPADKLPDGVRLTPLFQTSKAAERVSVTDPSHAIGARSTYYVGIAGSMDCVTDDGMRDTADFIWFSSSEAFTDEYAKATSNGNYLYFAEALSVITPSYQSPMAGISAVEIPSAMMNCPTGSAILWGVLLALIIPAGFLIAGLVIRSKRIRH